MGGLLWPLPSMGLSTEEKDHRGRQRARIFLTGVRGDVTFHVKRLSLGRFHGDVRKLRLGP
jgi:hypothetical protein